MEGPESDEMESPESDETERPERGATGGRRATGTFSTGLLVAVGMSPTVDDLRNEIRTAVGRYERVESTGFTKEALAAICEAVGYEAETNRRPSKSQMRAGILWKIGELESDDPEEAPSSFRKAELEAIAEALRDEE